jgi:hypothetical protein
MYKEHMRVLLSVAKQSVLMTEAEQHPFKGRWLQRCGRELQLQGGAKEAATAYSSHRTCQAMFRAAAIECSQKTKREKDTTQGEESERPLPAALRVSPAAAGCRQGAPQPEPAGPRQPLLAPAQPAPQPRSLQQGF